MTRYSGMAVFLAVAAACAVAMPLAPGAGRHWICDLNGFKQVNDRLGHLAGDQLLTEVAARLRIPGAVTARFGGNEFVLLCDDPDQAAAAHRLTARLHAALRPPITVAGEEVRIGASIGAVLSDTTRDADDLIRHADQAMYQDKATRRAA